MFRILIHYTLVEIVKSIKFVCNKTDFEGLESGDHVI